MILSPALQFQLGILDRKTCFVVETKSGIENADNTRTPLFQADTFFNSFTLHFWVVPMDVSI